MQEIIIRSYLPLYHFVSRVLWLARHARAAVGSRARYGYNSAGGLRAREGCARGWPNLIARAQRTCARDCKHTHTLYKHLSIIVMLWVKG